MFRLYLTSRAVSWAGSAMTVVALPVLLYQRTGSAALAGLLAGLEALPYLVLGLPAGALADRWDQRRTMIVASGLSGVILASIPVAELAGVLTTVQIFVVAIALSSIFVFFDAAGFGALPAIVGRDAVPKATGAMVSVSTAINLIGPAVGGVAATTLGAATVLALDSVTYLASALLLTRVRWTVTPSVHRVGRKIAQIRGDIAEGVRYIWNHRVIRTLTLIGAGSSITGGAVTGLLVVVAVRQLGLSDDDSRVGLLYACAAVGTLIISILLSRIQERFATGLITLTALAVNFVALILWSQNSIWIVGLGIIVLWQASNSLVILNGIVVRQAVTPQRLQSRVNTTARMIAWGGTPLGATLGGILAEAFGTRTALLVMSSSLLLSLMIGVTTVLRNTGKLAQLIEAEDAATGSLEPTAARNG